MEAIDALAHARRQGRRVALVTQTSAESSKNRSKGSVQSFKAQTHQQQRRKNHDQQ